MELVETPRQADPDELQSLKSWFEEHRARIEWERSLDDLRNNLADGRNPIQEIANVRAAQAAWEKTAPGLLTQGRAVPDAVQSIDPPAGDKGRQGESEHSTKPDGRALLITNDDRAQLEPRGWQWNAELRGWIYPLKPGAKLPLPDDRNWNGKLLPVALKKEIRIAPTIDSAQDRQLLKSLGAKRSTWRGAWVLPEPKDVQEEARLHELARDLRWETQTVATEKAILASTDDRKQLEKMGKWNPDLKGWVVPEVHRSSVDALAGERGWKIASLPTRSVLLIRGENTFVQREQIKAIGGKWDRELNGWVVPKAQRKAAEQLAQKQGWTVGRGEKAAETQASAARGALRASRAALGQAGRYALAATASTARGIYVVRLAQSATEDPSRIVISVALSQLARFAPAPIRAAIALARTVKGR